LEDNFSRSTLFINTLSADGMLCSCSAEGETFLLISVREIDFVCQDETAAAARHVPCHPSSSWCRDKLIENEIGNVSKAKYTERAKLYVRFTLSAVNEEF
jgi:hypothetical protein